MRIIKLFVVVFAVLLFFVSCSKSPEQKIDVSSKDPVANSKGQLIVWTNDMNLGVAVIDTQHRNLVNQINILNMYVLNNKSKEEKTAMLDKIIADVIPHFDTEEKLMTDYNYAGHKDNKALHSNFLQKCLEQQLKVKMGKEDIDSAVMNFFKEWITKHILGPDKDMCVYLASKGVK